MGKIVKVEIELPDSVVTLREYHGAVADLIDGIEEDGLGKVLSVTDQVSNKTPLPGHKPGCRGMERDDAVPGTPTIRPYPQWDPNKIISHNTDTSMYRSHDPLPRGIKEPNSARVGRSTTQGSFPDEFSETYNGVPNC